MSEAPTSHLHEALKLEADALIDLWEVRLKGVSIIARFWNGPERSWQGNTYEELACQLQGEGSGSSDQSVRPTLTVANPSKIFGPYAALGYFDLAEVIRKRVLQQDLIDDVDECQTNVWICGRVIGVMDQVLQLELRSPTDTPAWKTPRRTFSPPEFPFVVL